MLPKGRKNQFQSNVDKIVAAELAMQQTNQQAKINDTISLNKEPLSTKIIEKKADIINKITLMINSGEERVAMPLIVIGNADLEAGKLTLGEIINNNSNIDSNFEYDFNIVKSSNDIYILIIYNFYLLRYITHKGTQLFTITKLFFRKMFEIKFVSRGSFIGIM